MVTRYQLGLDLQAAWLTAAAKDPRAVALAAALKERGQAGVMQILMRGRETAGTDAEQLGLSEMPRINASHDGLVFRYRSGLTWSYHFRVLADGGLSLPGPCEVHEFSDNYRRFSPLVFGWSRGQFFCKPRQRYFGELAKSLAGI